MSEEKRDEQGVRISDLHLMIRQLQRLLSEAREEKTQLAKHNTQLCENEQASSLSLEKIRDFTSGTISYQNAAEMIREFLSKISDTGIRKKESEFLNLLRMVHVLDEDSRKLAMAREKWWYRFFNWVFPI